MESRRDDRVLGRVAEALPACTTSAGGGPILARSLRKSGKHTDRTMGFAFHAACGPGGPLLAAPRLAANLFAVALIDDEIQRGRIPVDRTSRTLRYGNPHIAAAPEGVQGLPSNRGLKVVRVHERGLQCASVPHNL